MAVVIKDVAKDGGVVFVEKAIESNETLVVEKENKTDNIFRRIYYFFMDIIKILSDWDKLMELLGLGK